MSKTTGESMSKQKQINDICEAVYDCMTIPRHFSESQAEGFMDLVEGSFNIEKFRKKLNELIPEDKNYNKGEGYDR